MNTIKWLTCVAAAAVLLGCERKSENSGASAGDRSITTGRGDNAAVESPSSTAADNSARNVRDRSDATLTPGDQGKSDADREVTTRIRRALTANDQLSMDAKNIKIITIDGKVTLRGPVKNAEELKTIQSIARQAGVTSLDSQLEVKTTNQ